MAVEGALRLAVSEEFRDRFLGHRFGRLSRPAQARKSRADALGFPSDSSRADALDSRADALDPARARRSWRGRDPLRGRARILRADALDSSRGGSPRDSIPWTRSIRADALGFPHALSRADALDPRGRADSNQISSPGQAAETRRPRPRLRMPRGRKQRSCPVAGAGRCGRKVCRDRAAEDPQHLPRGCRNGRSLGVPGRPCLRCRV
jgi:hypothetical protein